jgi:transcriptional regulator with XRE-family HTH domain
MEYMNMSWNVEYTDGFGEWWKERGPDTMSGHRPFSDLTRKFSPKRKARVAARVAELKAEMALAELRQARRRSQEELARALHVNQPAVAKLEKRTNMYVSNLRRYVEALGGELQITAKFPEGEVVIGNFSDIDTPPIRRREGKSTLRGITRGERRRSDSA